MKQLIILTTKENYGWASMQEIVPSLEEQWLKLQDTNKQNYEVKRFVFEDHAPKKMIKEIMKADFIIITSYCVPIALFLAYLRQNLGLNHFRLIFHLHGFSTFAMWPLYHWKLGKSLRTDDLFISSCTRDQHCFKTFFKDLPVYCVPFSLPLLKKPAPPKKSNSKVPFIFAGRISEQKNLHTLFYAFHLFKKRNPDLPFEFKIFGKEDHLGSPHIGKKSGPYLDFLLELRSQLQLENDISFLGHVTREVLDHEAQIQSIFVVSGLHSDENFGMAAFRFLCYGHLALLSDWGGHRDLKTAFPNQTTLIPVNSSAIGPWIDPLEMSYLLQKIYNHYPSSPHSPHIPTYYQDQDLHYEKILSIKHDSRPSQIPPIATQLVQRFLDYGQTMQIFTGYDDPLFQPFLKAYGMRPFQNDQNDTFEMIQLHPWVEVKDRTLKIHDPHRGYREQEFHSGIIQCIFYTSQGHNKIVMLCEKSAKQLLQDGLAFALPSSQYETLHELSIHSKKWLYQYCDQKVENPFYPDKKLGKNYFPQNVSIVDAIFFGSFPNRLIESVHWDFQAIRPWCLCSSVKKAFEQLFKINGIGVIERNIPTFSKIIPSQEITFIYAGRLSPAKNIEQLILFQHCWQHHFDHQSRLVFFGNFDSQEDHHHQEKTTNYEVVIHELISSLHWIHPPLFLGHYPSQVWANEPFINPLFVSFSLYSNEDFGVSVYQALMNQWPVFLTNWGGHQEVIGLKINPTRWNFFSSVDYVEFCNEFKMNLDRPRPFGLNQACEPAQTIPMELWKQKVQKAIKHYGPEILHLGRLDDHAFSLSKQGKDFYKKLQVIFTGH